MRHPFLVIVLVLLALIGFILLSSRSTDDGPDDARDSNGDVDDPVELHGNYTYEVIDVYPHDLEAFTQGLVYEDGVLFEGTGLYGRSSIRKVDLTTGEVLQIHNLSADHFGEGITIFHDRIIQLTWKSNIGFVYDKESFEMLETFNYASEGWGITHDGGHLIMSDGTPTLHFLDPDTYQEMYTIEVGYNGEPVDMLNELEYIDGEVYANIWQTDDIVKIDPSSGNITGWIDLEGLLDPDICYTQIDVLNGIAYDELSKRLFVTGKLWPKLFEITIVDEK